MCIAHLGHLHHTLSQEQLNEIGRIDVLFVPVDGNLTLDLEGMMEVLQAIKAPLMVPMHLFQHLHAEPLFRSCPRAEMGSGDESNAVIRGSRKPHCRRRLRSWCCRDGEHIALDAI